jgi:23S rRNA-intervening sequence protein
LAEGNSTGENHISGDTELPIGRKVWTGSANAARGRIRAVEYRGGPGPPYDRSVCPILSHAEGSVAELDTQIILSCELRFCEQGAAAGASELIGEIRRMLNALRRKLIAKE